VNPHVVPRRRAQRPHIVGLVIAVALVVASADADAQGRRKPRRGKKKPPAEQPVKAEPGVDVAGAPPEPATGAAAGGGPSPAPSAAGKKGKAQVFDFTGLELAGTMRMPQLLYFLDRAEEELERASLERRSFIPAMVRSIEEEAL
jgi:hypothetical protein